MPMPNPAPSPPSPGDADRLTRFLLPQAGVRGVHVRLAETWREILSHGQYPHAVAELLGEAAAASALLTGHAKVEGRLSIQMRGPGSLRTVFAECTAAGTLRGIAQLEEGAELPAGRDLRALGEGAILAITIENPSPGNREAQRYQGLVPVESDSLATSLEDYFRQSEQLPTRLHLAVDQGTAVGVMLQKLPGDEGDEDGWNRAGLLLDTLTTDEALALPADKLLHRLFGEEGLVLLGDKPLRFACSCSRDRVTAMLESLGPDEARAALVDGQVEVRCEFCGQFYRFSATQIDALFAPRESLTAEAPSGLQ